MSGRPLRYVVLTGVALASVATLSACARTPTPGTQATGPAKPATHATVPASSPEVALPLVIVHKNESCGCCRLWVKHLQDAGFTVEVRNEDNLNPIKERVGVPLGHGSCHTAEVGGYFVEGHVPAADIRRLLIEKPKAKGLVLPGMPLGSPGMEVPSGEVQRYVVSLVGTDGAPRPYAQHGQ